jgi:hypothetical protein
MRIVVFACLAALGLAACSKRDPVAEGANAAAAEIDVLPPDESSATPTSELESGEDVPLNAADEIAPGRIPAALHGRWGLTPGDCTSTRGDAKGLLVVSGESLKFYESRAVPPRDLKTSGTSASGEFTFTGEGMNWKKYEALELRKNKLVRTESNPIASFTYARCAG